MIYTGLSREHLTKYFVFPNLLICRVMVQIFIRYKRSYIVGPESIKSPVLYKTVNANVCLLFTKRKSFLNF